MQGLLGRKEYSLFTLLYEKKPILHQSLGTLGCRRVLSASRLSIHHGKGTKYKLYGGGQGLFRDTMVFRPPETAVKCRTYRTTSWLRENVRNKASGSNSSIVTKSKKGKVIYSMQRTSKPNLLNEEIIKSTDPLTTAMKNDGAMGANGGLGDKPQMISCHSSKIVNSQAIKHKVKPNKLDEVQKLIVDKVSPPQFTHTSPHVAQSSLKMKKCRSVKVRKVCQSSNNLLNWVCNTTHVKSKMKTELSENKSLPELENNRLYHFGSADNPNKMSINKPGTFVELMPRRIRFSSREMLYPDKDYAARGGLKKKVEGKEPLTGEGKYVKMKCIDDNIQQNKLGLAKKNAPEKDLKHDVLVTPLEEVGGVQVFMKGTNPEVTGLNKTVKELFTAEIPGGVMLGGNPELELAVEGVNIPSKQMSNLKNNSCLFTERNRGSGLSEVGSEFSSNTKENLPTKKVPEILSLRKNENLTIHKHCVKRSKKENKLTYEAQVIEKEGKTITKLRPRKMKRAQNDLRAKSTVKEQGKSLGENVIKVSPTSEMVVRDSDQSSAILPVKNPSVNISRATDLSSKYDRPDLNKLGVDNSKTNKSHSLKTPEQTFDEIVNSMRSEADSFLKQSNSDRPNQADETQPMMYKSDTSTKEYDLSNGQRHVPNKPFLSKLKVAVQDQLVRDNNVEGQLKESGSFRLPLTQNPSLPNGGRKGNANDTRTFSSGSSVPEVLVRISKNLNESTSNKQASTQRVQHSNESIKLPSEAKGVGKEGDFGKSTWSGYGQGKVDPKSGGLDYSRNTELKNEQRKFHKDDVPSSSGPAVEGNMDVSLQSKAFTKQSFNENQSSGFQNLRDSHPVLPTPSFSAKVNCNPLNLAKPLREPINNVDKREQRKVTKKVFNSCKAEHVDHNLPIPPSPKAEYQVQFANDKLHMDTKKRGFIVSWFEQYRADATARQKAQGKSLEQDPHKLMHETNRFEADSFKTNPSYLATLRQHGTDSPSPSVFFSSNPPHTDTGAMKGSHGRGDAGWLSENRSTLSQTSSSAGFACGGAKAGCVPACKPVFPPIISNTGASKGCSENPSCVPTCKPVFPPPCKCDASANNDGCGLKPSCPPPCCPTEAHSYERPVVNFGPPSSCPPCCPPPSCCPPPPPCCPPPPPCCPPPPPYCAAPMKSKTYSVLDVSHMAKPPTPIFINCLPKEKPCFPPKPPGDQNLSPTSYPAGCSCNSSTSSPYNSYPVHESAILNHCSSMSWLDVTKTYFNDRMFYVKCLVTEIITKFLALIKTRTYFKKAEECSSYSQSSMIANNQPLVNAALKISEKFKPRPESCESEKKRLVKKKARFIKMVKKSVHDDQSRQAILLEEERRRAIGSKANPMMAYSEVLNIVFNQKSEFPAAAKRQKRRSCIN